MTNGLKPFLFPSIVAAYPALLVASGNVPEYSAIELFSVIALGVAAGAAVHWVTARVWSDRASPAAVAVSAAAANAWLFCALHIAARVTTLHGHGPALAQIAGAVGSIALAGRISRTVLASRGFARLAERFSLALVALVLLAIGVGRARIARDYASSALVREWRAPLPAADRSARRPDVYLLILDNVANADVMRRVYGVEDGFADSLRALGFVVPPVTRSNYSFTAQSVASLLNAGHVAGLQADLGAASDDRGVLFRLSQDNRVSRWFRAAGYDVYFQPSIGFTGTARNASASGVYMPSGLGRAQMALARADLLRSYLDLTTPGRLLNRLGFEWARGDARLFPLRTVAEVARRPSPKFVIAHSLAAHDPYVFTASCSEFADADLARRSPASVYPETVRCTQRAVLAAVQQILASSAAPPVIILQADHGSRSLGAPFFGSAALITPPQARERLGAFGAYYLPGGTLPDTVTTVNVFRYVLRYLGAPVAPVPDSAYFTTYDQPYRFVNVTPYLAGPGQATAGSATPPSD